MTKREAVVRWTGPLWMVKVVPDWWQLPADAPPIFVLKPATIIPTPGEIVPVERTLVLGLDP